MSVKDAVLARYDLQSSSNFEQVIRLRQIASQLEDETHRLESQKIEYLWMIYSKQIHLEGLLLKIKLALMQLSGSSSGENENRSFIDIPNVDAVQPSELFMKLLQIKASVEATLSRALSITSAHRDCLKRVFRSNGDCPTIRGLPLEHILNTNFDQRGSGDYDMSNVVAQTPI